MTQRGPFRTLIETADIFRSRGWTVFAFGGAPRGVYDNGNRYSPRDIDLVFDDEHFEYFESAFGNYVLRRNSYGGLRLKVKGLMMDAWPLSATWAFREGHIASPSFESLPSTTFLNIDGIVIEVVPAKGKSRRIYECGFFTGWRERTLDINLRKNPHPGICVARTLHIASRFNFQLSYRLAVYLWEMLRHLSLSALETAQTKHYGKVEFAAPVLLRLRNRLERHLDSNAQGPIWPFTKKQMEFDPQAFNLPAMAEQATQERGASRTADDYEDMVMQWLFEDTDSLRRSIHRSGGKSGRDCVRDPA